MIVEVHRHNQSPMWFYNCRKNKPNKLKKAIRTFIFFASTYQYHQNLSACHLSGVKLLIKTILITVSSPSFSMFGKH
jgi:hypothetical protein